MTLFFEFSPVDLSNSESYEFSHRLFTEIWYDQPPKPPLHLQGMIMRNLILSTLAALLVMVSASIALAGSDNRVPYREKVSVRVGESIVIHGLRGDCGKYPVKSKNSGNGKAIRRYRGREDSSREKGDAEKSELRGSHTCCRGYFCAQKKGRTKIKLFGDPVSIRVKK